MKESTQTSPAENSDDSIVTWLLYFKRTSDKIAFAEFQKSVKTTSSSSLALMLATTNQAIYAYFSMIGSHSSRVFSLLFVLILLLVVYGWTLLLTSIIMDQKRKMLQSGRVVRSNSNATGISSGEGEDSFVTDKSISSEAVEETKKTLSAEVLPSRNFVTDTIIAAATKLADRFSNQLDHNVMDTILILGISLYSGLRLMTRTIQGQCYDNSYLNSFGCNPYFAAGGIPPDTLFGISLLPLMVASLSRYAGWTTVLSSWVISILFMSLSAIINGEKSYGLLWGIAVAYIPCSAIVLFETRRQNIDIFLVNRDLNQVVTENKKMAEAIRKDELRSMIGNIAHDLKTPLAAFTNGTEFISKAVEELRIKCKGFSISAKDAMVDSLTSIDGIVLNMRNINSFMTMTINRCIDYTKASKGICLFAKLSSFNLKDELQLPFHCMKDLQQNDVIIEHPEVSPEICSHIITDKQWLQENVLCLLSNAFKYSNNGRVTVKLRLTKLAEIYPLTNDLARNHSTTPELNEDQSLAGANDFIMVEVEDTGIGISIDVREQLFNPFKQAQRMAGGTGLGLYSLAKRLEALKGFYGVKGRRDGKQGTLMWFAIPYRPDNTASQEYFTADLKPLKGRNTEAFSILIVDDAVSITKMCGKMLEQLGHSVSVAQNGAEAVEKVEKRFLECQSSQKEGSPQLLGFYDLILMDLQMPIMDGLEATRRIREFLKNNRAEDVSVKTDSNPMPAVNLKIIGLSANSDHETTRLAYLSGVDSFLPKPFTIQTFEETYNKISTK